MWHSERLCLRVACVIALPPFVLAAFADPPSIRPARSAHLPARRLPC